MGARGRRVHLVALPPRAAPLCARRRDHAREGLRQLHDEPPQRQARRGPQPHGDMAGAPGAVAQHLGRDGRGLHLRARQRVRHPFQQHPDAGRPDNPAHRRRVHQQRRRGDDHGQRPHDEPPREVQHILHPRLAPRRGRPRPPPYRRAEGGDGLAPEPRGHSPEGVRLRPCHPALQPRAKPRQGAARLLRGRDLRAWRPTGRPAS